MTNRIITDISDYIFVSDEPQISNKTETPHS